MSKVICEREDLVAIADAVRSKTGSTEEMTLGEIASGINEISASDSASNDMLRSLIDRTITEINDDSIKNVGPGAFQYCDSLTTVSLPAATSIGDYAFSYCDSLTTVSLPAATSIGPIAFNRCDSLTTVSLPAATSIGLSAFNRCDSLTTVSLPAATSIGPSAFQNCTNLSAIYLEALTMCRLENVNAFDGTAITSQSGFIFVPAFLVDSYKTETNWANFSARIFAIGSEIVETLTFTIAGTNYQCETDMTWREWIASDYNVDGYYVIDDMYVCQAGTTDTVVAHNSGYVSITDTIIPAKTYWVDPY